jgi:hypothetical protein
MPGMDDRNAAIETTLFAGLHFLMVRLLKVHEKAA